MSMICMNSKNPRIWLFVNYSQLSLIRTAGTAFFYYVKIWKSSVFKKLYMAYPNFIIKFTNVLGDFVQFRESLIVFGLERFGLKRGDCIVKYYKIMQNILCSIVK